VKQKQRDKSTTTIATIKPTAAINSGLQIDPRATVPAPARQQEEGAHANPRNGVELHRVWADNAIAQRVGQSASDDLDYPRKRDKPHRSDDQSQSKREERPRHGRRGRWEEQRAYGCGDGDGDGGDTRHCGVRRRNHSRADGEKRVRKAEKVDRGLGYRRGPQRLEVPHGEDDATAGPGANAAAPDWWTPNKPTGSTGSP